MSALWDQTMAFTAAVTSSKKSQQHKKVTPKFQLWRTKLVVSTKSSMAEARMQAMGCSG